MSDNVERTISRRNLTKALGVVGATGLAGCAGNGGDGGDGGDGSAGGFPDTDNELGERVPSLALNYFAGIYSTRFSEATVPIAKQNWKDGLGVDVEPQGKSVSTWVGEITGGTFAYNIAYSTAQTTPSRLDPNFVIRDFFRIDGAGSRNEAGISLNYGRYASCDYSIPAWEQETAPSEEQRREMVNEAQRVLAEDYAAIPVGPQGTFGAYDSAELDGVELGTFGINNHNIINIISAVPKNGTTKVMATPIPNRLRSLNPYLSPNPVPRLTYEYSTLLMYGPNADLRPYLAEDWEVSNEAKTYEFTLKDATFQNGDPITASDVKFSFEFLQENGGELQGGVAPGFESIETPDDSTVVVNFAESNPAFLSDTIVKVGILNEDVWADATENPANFSPPMGTASGPFAATEFESERLLVLETHDGHPMAPDPSEFDTLEFRGFSDENTMVQALGAGEIMTIASASFSSAQQAGEFDTVETTQGLAYIPNVLNPDFAQAPTKFQEFRQALGMAINRQEMLTVGLPGLDIDPELHPRPFWKTHPWAAPADMLPTFTDDPTGDFEGARQVLVDAGWGWDDEGNLHYPADADLEPRWPDGEAPSPDNFPCLDTILNG